MKMARLDSNGKIIELFEIETPVHISKRFHPDLVAQFVEVPDNTQINIKSYINGQVVDTPAEGE